MRSGHRIHYVECIPCTRSCLFGVLRIGCASLLFWRSILSAMLGLSICFGKLERIHPVGWFCFLTDCWSYEHESFGSLVHPFLASALPSLLPNGPLGLVQTGPNPALRSCVVFFRFTTPMSTYVRPRPLQRQCRCFGFRPLPLVLQRRRLPRNLGYGQQCVLLRLGIRLPVWLSHQSGDRFLCLYDRLLFGQCRRLYRRGECSCALVRWLVSLARKKITCIFLRRIC